MAAHRRVPFLHQETFQIGNLIEVMKLEKGKIFLLQQMTIALSPDNMSVWCVEFRSYSGAQYGGRMLISLRLLNPSQLIENNLQAVATVVLLGTECKEISLNFDLQAVKVSADGVMARIAHAALKESAETLLPDGLLTIVVKIEVLAATNSIPGLFAKHGVMPPSRFFPDHPVRPTRVSLFFNDGMLRCESSLLTERYGLVWISSENSASCQGVWVKMMLLGFCDD